jgi:hypothetical protein
MKITDYKILVAPEIEGLEAEVKTFILEGWEVYGPMLFHGRRLDFCQPMVKKFDPHEGQVWVKVPGERGAWLPREVAAST